MADKTASPTWEKAEELEKEEERLRIQLRADGSAPVPFSQKVRRIRIMLNLSIALAVALILIVALVPIEESYHATGRVRPASDRELLAPADLIKETRPEVYISQHVTTGTVLMRFLVPELDMEIEETETLLDNLRAELELLQSQTATREKMPLPKELWEMNEQLAKSQANVDYFMSQLKRAQTLAKQGVASDQEVDKARLQYEQAKIEHERLTQRVGVVDEGYGQALIAEARAKERLTQSKIEGAERRLAILRKRLDRLSVLRAPVAGIVLEMPHKDTIGRIKDGETLAVMSVGDNRLVEIYGGQKNFDKVALGQTVRYRSQVWDPMKFGYAEGKVVLISLTRHPDRTSGTDQRFYTILASIERQPKEMPLDSLVDAQIVLSKDRLFHILFKRD